jgi:hypothetical protein
VIERIPEVPETKHLGMCKEAMLLHKLQTACNAVSVICYIGIDVSEEPTVSVFRIEKFWAVHRFSSP